MVKNPPANAGDLGSIPGSGRSPEEENGNRLQYSCLEDPTGRGIWQAIVHGVPKSRRELSNYTTTPIEIYTKQEFPKNKSKLIHGKKC